jgi:hypothetical protein
VSNVRDTSYEMVRIRVLFLEPGNLIHPSELDDGITEYTKQEKRMIYGEDYADFNVYKINSAALADSIHMGSELMCEIVSTPNDPCVEMLVPMTVVYFDLLEMDSDWSSPGGGIGSTLENIGIWETFGDDYDTIVQYAKRLTSPGNLRAHRDEWGTKVQFMAMYKYQSWTDYWGEWDCDHGLVGYFSNADVRVQKFHPGPMCPDVNDVIKPEADVLM